MDGVMKATSTADNDKCKGNNHVNNVVNLNNDNNKILRNDNMTEANINASSEGQSLIDWRTAVVEWCPMTKQVYIFDNRNRDPTLLYCMGGAYFPAIGERDYDDNVVALDMLLQFHTITVRDGLPVDEVHKVFMKVGQYRDRISPDSPGM